MKFPKIWAAILIAVFISSAGAFAIDTDGDGIDDSVDNCPTISNSDQGDDDGDGIGNLCDNCVNTVNPSQADADSNGVGDACELPPSEDIDRDGVANSVDNCVIVPNPGQEDADFDGAGDACDYSEAGQADVYITLNDGENVAYIGRENLLQIWIANGTPVNAVSMDWLFTIASGDFTFISGYGNRPANTPFVQEHGDFDNTLDFFKLQVAWRHFPDTLILSGVANSNPYPVHSSHALAYSMKFVVQTATPQTEGFCLDNIYSPPSVEWAYNDVSGLFAPYFQGQPNTSTAIPDAPSVCFDVAYYQGDCNGDGFANISDVVYLVNYIFIGGPAPLDLTTADVDCSGVVNISDVVYMLYYIFTSGPAPCQK